MKLKLICLLLLMFPYSQVITCQTKYEKEERIKISDLPKMTLSILETLPENCKRIKYYKETDNEKVSYEIKFKFKKQSYSIEFSENGFLEDIEIIIKFKNIENLIGTQIKKHLNQSYTKYKFTKIQEQYIYYPKNDTSEFIHNVMFKKQKIKPNYEIIAEVKNGKQHKIKEFLFDENGEFLNYRILDPTSYEHVLY